MNPATLVYINSRDENEVIRLRKTIEEKREQIEELTVTVENLKAEVDLFQHRYNAHVGRHYLELEKVDLETKEYRLRLQLKRENLSEEEIEKRVESCFREIRMRISAAEEGDGSEQDSESDKLPEEEAKYFQSLYRRLAKRFHPDKAENSKEKKRRKKLMPLINRAYDEQDVKVLERLSVGDFEMTLQFESSAAEKREKLQSELRSLYRVSSELRSEINRVKAGRTYQLKQEVEKAEENGQDMLSVLAGDLIRKVKSGQSQLTRLINMWRQTSRI